MRIGKRFTVYILLGLAAAPQAVRAAGSDATPAAPAGSAVVQPNATRRPGRLIRRDEVVAAIFSALRANGIPEAATLLPSDIHFTAPVTVSAADAELQVRRMDFDPALKEARFLLASAADPHSLPFLVTAPLRERSESSVDPAPASPAAAVASKPLAGNWPGLALHRASAVDRIDRIPSGAMLLVDPKTPATLHVFSGTMQMFLEVIPLDRGALHDTVRVRVPETGRILRGRVVAAGRLEAQF